MLSRFLREGLIFYGNGFNSWKLSCVQEKQRLANSVDELQDIVYSKTFKAPSAWADRERKYKMEKLTWETQAARQHVSLAYCSQPGLVLLLLCVRMPVQYLGCIAVLCTARQLIARMRIFGHEKLPQHRDGLQAVLRSV